MDILCKIFKFVLGVFKRVVQFVADGVKIVANALVDVLDTVAKGVSKVVFGNLPLIAGLAIGAFFLFGKKSDKGKGTTIALLRPSPSAQGVGHAKGI